MPYLRSLVLGFITCLVLVACAPQGANKQAPVRSSGQQTQAGYAYPSQATPPGSYGYMPQVQSMEPAQTVKVGLLLPLTGRAQTVGSALQDAAVLALFDKYATVSPQQARIQIELVPADTKGNAEDAALAAKQVLDQGVQLIIGPLFSDSVRAVAPIAKQRNVQVLSFSNNEQVAGEGTYLFGFTPEEQVERVAQYAFSSGVNQVAVLAPNTPYGQKVAASMKTAAKAMGKIAEPVMLYAAEGGNVSQQVDALIAKAGGGSKVPFDGLFLPEGSGVLEPMLAALESRNITPARVRFLGTGLWDDESIRRRYNLSGAWYASSPNESYQRFEQRFEATYNYTPPRIASLAYDATALAATLASAQTGFGPAALASPVGYSGPANGIFRLTPQGRVQRGLAVLEVNGGDVRTIDPAPTYFR